MELWERSACELGDILRHTRIAKKIPISEMAKKMNTDKNTVGRIESGDNYTIRLLFSYLQVLDEKLLISSSERSI